MTQQQRDIKRKLAALRYAEEYGNVALTARRFGISRQCFYIWKRAYETHGENGRRVKRYQFTAIDDATRIRALRIYERHNQGSAIDFIAHVVERFPLRIHTIRTDNGREWQAQFHWHCEDLGMRHVHVKPGRPNLNGKVERSHLTDQLEFYQLLDYTGDVDLRAKLAVWEEFYNLQRPHAVLDGRTP